MYVDTNILIRLATNDIPQLAAEADRLLSACRHRSVIVDNTVVEEATFVLQKYDKYLLPRETIMEVMKVVLARDELVVDAAVFRALEMFALHPKLDFVDCLLAVKAGGKRKNLLTFDTELQRALR